MISWLIAPSGDPLLFLLDLAWSLLRSLITFLICFLLGLVGIVLLDKLTPEIREVKMIGGKPLPTALFAAGFLIYLGLIYYASMVAPLPVGIKTGIGYTVTTAQLLAYRLIALVAGLLISLLFAFIFYRVMARIEPFGIDLDDVQKEPIAIGVFVFAYLIFLGLILFTALLLP